MLCEGRLLSMSYSEVEKPRPLPSHGPAHSIPATLSNLEQAGHVEESEEGYISPLQSFRGSSPDRHASPEIQIPTGSEPDGDTPFLVPSCCQSICQDYSDLHIGGEQVLPLSGNEGEPRLITEALPPGPFLQSCDVPPAAEDSLLPLLAEGWQRWRQGSGRDRSFLLLGLERPCSNSLLNQYLEQKLLDLYQQYMMENMAREGEPGPHADPAPICPLLGSETALSSLEQITLQLSREGNLEVGVAKELVRSCLLRVSTEISTPFLQISNEESTQNPQL